MKERQHQTLYRAYRPATFEEVRGQAQVTDVLKAAIKNKKIAHAYLFSGSRGTGKTSVARILARELGVSNKDLYEIDAASNTGVDHIRELREGVNVVPFESPYKFYIIDEAHMLSRNAWNAFLKTLEEPPSHVIFVLATTERDKVPDTIQSRCEIYTFKQPTREILADIVTDVAKSEGYSLERSAAELVGLLAEGSFRDALSILQKVLTVTKDPSETGKPSHGAGKKVDVAEVEMVTGAPRAQLVRTILKAITEKNATDALKAIQAAEKDNIDMRILARLLIHRMRVVLLLRHAPDLAEEFGKELSEEDLLLAKELTNQPGAASEVLKILLEAHSTMAYAAVPHLPLEMAVIDICSK